MGLLILGGLGSTVKTGRIVGMGLCWAVDLQQSFAVQRHRGLKSSQQHPLRPHSVRTNDIDRFRTIVELDLSNPYSNLVRAVQALQHHTMGVRTLSV